VNGRAFSAFLGDRDKDTGFADGRICQVEGPRKAAASWLSLRLRRSLKASYEIKMAVNENKTLQTQVEK